MKPLLVIIVVVAAILAIAPPEVPTEAPEDGGLEFVVTDKMEMEPPPAAEPLEPQQPVYPPLPEVPVKEPKPAAKPESDLFYTPISEQVKKIVADKTATPPQPVIDPASEPPKGLIAKPALVTHDNLATAKSHSRASDKLILAIWTQADCAPCKIVKERVLTTPAVRDYVAANFVLALIDTAKYPRAADTYKVFGLPTAFLLDSKGAILSRFVPVTDPAEFLTQLKARRG